MGSRRAASTLNKEGRMRTVLAIAVAMSLVAGTISVASAADEKKPNPQQQRMKACNAQAGDKKGGGRLLGFHQPHVALVHQLESPRHGAC